MIASFTRDLQSTMQPDNSHPLPPPPPPPPPLPKTFVSKNDKLSGFNLKVRSAPEGYFFDGSSTTRPSNPFKAPIGPYFVYGTLMDPGMLSERLGLCEVPRLRPARIVGYSCKAWGQYPALVTGATDEVVEGMVYVVTTEKQAERLASYETGNYVTERVLVSYLDAGDPGKEDGLAFVFAGRVSELDDGRFDFQTWLRRMGRG